MARAAGGSLLVTTSARTKRASVLALRTAITVPCHFFRWAGKSADNPFYGYLALADSFIVTCDSASMLAEACATRRPVYMFDLGAGPSGAPPKRAEETLDRRIRRWWRDFEFDRLKAFVYRQMLKVPPRRMTRDIRLIHRFLIVQRRAVWLGQPFPAWTPPPLDEMTPTVARVRGLLDGAPEYAAAAGHDATSLSLHRQRV